MAIGATIPNIAEALPIAIALQPTASAARREETLLQIARRMRGEILAGRAGTSPAIVEIGTLATEAGPGVPAEWVELVVPAGEVE